MAANAIDGVPKPSVSDVVEWSDGELRVRAELQTLAPSPALSNSITPPPTLTLDTGWWAELRAALAALASQPTDRICLDARLLERRVRAFFGVAVDLDDVAWAVAHGDLQWSNVTGPICWLLDWEAWGTAPRGYDAATLYCASLTDPRLAARVHEQFGDLLDSPTGRIAQLAAAAKLLGLVEHGEHPELAAPLHAHAHALYRRS
ncbi:MAG: aminoglycoside phosphotransferase [Solirubrobacteraceae bacterium]